MNRKLKLVSKYILSQPQKQAVAIHVFPNISRSKGNQIMKFGHLAEYNMREKHFSWKIIQKNVVEKLFADTF